jgi:hypothetical protein
MDQVSIKYTSIFHCKTLQIYPNLDILFENKPSGNPALDSFTNTEAAKVVKFFSILDRGPMLWFSPKMAKMAFLTQYIAKLCKNLGRFANRQSDVASIITLTPGYLPLPPPKKTKKYSYHVDYM